MKSRRIWPLARLRLALAGRTDARHGEPAPREAGTWSSPFALSLINECLEIQSRLWQECMELTSPLYESLDVERARLESARQELAQAKARLEARPAEDAGGSASGNRPPADPQVVERRRARLAAAQLISARQVHDEVVARIARHESAIVALQARIDSAETSTRLSVLRETNYADRRIALYWRRAIRGRVEGASAIPNPPVAPLTGEEIYRERLAQPPPSGRSTLVPGPMASTGHLGTGPPMTDLTPPAPSSGTAPGPRRETGHG